MTIFHQKLDLELENCEYLTPLEKERIRGAVMEVEANYYAFLANHKPTSNLVHDVKNELNKAVLNVQNGLNLDDINHKIRAFNSKVPCDCQLNASLIFNVCSSIKARMDNADDASKPILTAVK